MKILSAIITVAAIGLVAGCDHEHDHTHGHARESEASHGHSHGDDAQSFSGATHKEGTGITLLPQTKQLLGIETSEVSERKLARRVQWLARVYQQGSHESSSAPKPSSPSTFAAGITAVGDGDHLKRGLSVDLIGPSGRRLRGEIIDIHRSLSSSEIEVVTRLDAEPDLPLGTFLRAEASLPMEQMVSVVPAEAVVRGAETNHVYVVNGNAYLRTLVETGLESDGFVEIREGLLAGDSVVSRGALDLWLIELRAVKGGQGCCPAPPARNRD